MGTSLPSHTYIHIHSHPLAIHNIVVIVEYSLHDIVLCFNLLNNFVLATILRDRSNYYAHFRDEDLEV